MYSLNENVLKIIELYGFKWVLPKLIKVIGKNGAFDPWFDYKLLFHCKIMFFFLQYYWICETIISDLVWFKCIFKCIFKCFFFKKKIKGSNIQKQPSRSNFIEITLRYGCSPVNLLHIFRTPFPENTHGRLLLNIP